MKILNNYYYTETNYSKNNIKKLNIIIMRGIPSYPDLAQLVEHLTVVVS